MRLSIILYAFTSLLCFNTTAQVQPVFRSQVLDSSISIGYGIVVGDVDGDKKPDILVADKKQFVWYRNGDWKKFVIAENVTELDNVCIAARDIDGDGKVEVAVGAQWNPAETSDSTRSGSVHVLVRPEDPTQRWRVLTLPHEPTIHRMRWVRAADGNAYLAVLPLHGKGNRNGEGTPVKILLFKVPVDVDSAWTLRKINTKMHMTHNMDVIAASPDSDASILVAGKEGVRSINTNFKSTEGMHPDTILNLVRGAGEVKSGRLTSARSFITTVEPMHGNEVAVYIKDVEYKRVLLDGDVKEGHALAVADFLGVGSDQIVAGWRNPNNAGKTGIRLYAPVDLSGAEWRTFVIDDNLIACEDIQAVDLNGDGKIDIVASGRATRNVKIYWNLR